MLNLSVSAARLANDPRLCCRSAKSKAVAAAINNERHHNVVERKKKKKNALRKKNQSCFQIKDPLPPSLLWNSALRRRFLSSELHTLSVRVTPNYVEFLHTSGIRMVVNHKCQFNKCWLFLLSATECASS